jgi:hypothetical protein
VPYRSEAEPDRFGLISAKNALLPAAVALGKFG